MAHRVRINTVRKARDGCFQTGFSGEGSFTMAVSDEEFAFLDRLQREMRRNQCKHLLEVQHIERLGEAA